MVRALLAVMVRALLAVMVRALLAVIVSMVSRWGSVRVVCHCLQSDIEVAVVDELYLARPLFLSLLLFSSPSPTWPFFWLLPPLSGIQCTLGKDVL